MSTKNSSATAMISNGQAIFSRYSVRTQNTVAASTKPTRHNMSWRVR